MNKKELIDYCNAIKENKSQIINCIDINRIIKKIEQLDEPQKVTIPHFVADWLKLSKSIGRSLFGAMRVFEKDDDVEKWLQWSENQELFARAWLDGYEIQETRYVVTDGNHLYFKGYQEDVDIVILVDEQPGTMDFVKKFDSKEEAQKAADILGWKVQEVE